MERAKVKPEEEKVSCTFCHMHGLPARGYSISPAARLRRGGKERKALRKHSSFSHDLSKRLSDLPPSSHALEIPRSGRLFGAEE